MRHFTFAGERSQRFWDIELNGASLTVRYGKAGSKGQGRTKTFADEAKARAEHDRLIRAKLAAGYVEAASASAAPPPAPASLRESLESALVENPDDLAAHSA